MSWSVDKALESTYSAALKESTRKLKTFLQKYKAVMDGTYPVPQYYIDTGKVQFWRDGFVNALMREHEVVDQLAVLLAECRGKNQQTFMRHLQNEYGHGRLEELKTIIDGCKEYGLQPSFTMMDKRAIKIAVDDSVKNAPMSKIKVLDDYDENDKFVRQYIDIVKDSATRRKLQQQLGVSIANGQSQTKLISRIRDVFGQQISNAKRIAQTQGTRVRNEARYQADQEAAQMGIEMQRIWTARFSNTRDGHAQVDGTPADENGGWFVPWKSGKDSGEDYMLYPGDPNGCAANVCNCHCTVISRVKTSSPALQRFRSDMDSKRSAWKAQNAEQNDWRDRLFYDADGQPVHPYARRP